MSDMGWAHYEQEEQRIEDEDAAYAQHEMESRRLQEELAADPGYLEWLNYIEATSSQRTEIESWD